MDRVSGWVYKLSVWLLIILFATMVGAILLDVFTLNLLNFSFIWANELSQFCFIWITFIGASAVYKQKEMIALELLLTKLPQKFQNWAVMLVQIIVILFSIVFMYYGFKKAFSPSMMLQTSIGLHVPMLVPYISIPLGMLMLLIHALTDIINNLKLKWKKERGATI